MKFISHVKVAITDDHKLLRNGLANLVNSFSNFEVTLQAGNGNELMQLLRPDDLPDITLLDINMSEMDGYETADWLRKTYPQVKILALSMMDTESAIIRMIKNGARGYVLKDADPSELNEALNAVMSKGYYYNDLVTGKLIFSINKMGDDEKVMKALLNLTDKEIQFLKLICTDDTYKEIAAKLMVGPRTVDGYRDALSEKLKVKTRVGLVLFALMNDIICL
ncbi:MAG: response regulator transcription factor [Chitinophagaceae bacterium]